MTCPYHAQAVDMAQLVPGRSQDQQVIALAANIEKAGSGDGADGGVAAELRESVIRQLAHISQRLGPKPEPYTV
jgi:hypothetical protein